MPRRCQPLSRRCLLVMLTTLVVLGRPTPVIWAAESLREVLERTIIEPSLPLEEVKRFCERRVVRMPPLSDREYWEREAQRIRREVLDKVVFRGEAAQWRTARTRVEWLDELEGGPGYRIKKLRYEALPGLWIPALLYEPAELSGQVPVVLNVNGHDGAGKAAPYKQIRCINQAKRGMLALNIEWLGMGQLRHENFQHYRMNQLDLCGTSGLAPFYLAMQRGLDVLLARPHADSRRVAVAGLSGGGWQTILLSSLDTRVTLANPVAGYSSFLTRIDHASDLGDSEQTPVDLATVADYTHLTALMAPRATLLTYNLQDNCCFASPHALPPLLEAAGPVFELYGKRDLLRQHVNHDPGTHNFEKDNRQALYAMLRDQFAGGAEAFSAEEIDCAQEVKTAEQLRVELPEANLDFQQLAERLTAKLPHQADLPREREPALAWQAAGRARLRDVAKMAQLEVRSEQAGQVAGDGFQATLWKLRLADAWTVPAVEFQPDSPAGTTILLADGGRREAADRAAQLLKQGQRVVAVDPFYFGESKIAGRDFLMALLVSAVGERPLGVQAGQVASIARWLHAQRPLEPIRLEALGPRTSLIALVAAGGEPKAIGGLRLERCHASLKQVIRNKGSVDKTPEMFCFGLLAEFDIRQLAALTAPRPVKFAQADNSLRDELGPLATWYQAWNVEFDPLAP